MGVSDCGILEMGTRKNAQELKNELHKLTTKIVTEDEENENEANLDTVNEAIQTLLLLKEMKLKKNQKNKRYFSSEFDDLNVPDEYRCPISREIMRDPVILATGQTYDRPFIQKWLKEGERTCPQTQQLLSHTVLTSNHLVRELIAQWCKDRRIELPRPIQDSDDIAITKADKDRLDSLLDKISSSSSSLSDKKQSAKAIRSLTKRMPSSRSFFVESSHAIPQLLTPLTSRQNLNHHPDLHEDLITVVLNLSIHENNKKLIGEHPIVIPLLIDSLECGNIETKTNSAAALFTLSALDSNKHLIGKLGALNPLINLLEEGHPLAMKDVASAIFNLCAVVENRVIAIREGAVKVILEKIKDRVLVDELLAILAFLSSNHKAIEKLAESEAVGCLLGIIRENTCERNNENCIVILHSICVYNRSKLKEVREEEIVNRTISKVAENGTMRAKRKANGILERLKRGIYLTHSA